MWDAPSRRPHRRATVAPSQASAADQTLGQSLAAIDAFVTQEKANYAQLTPALQAAEKPYLNNLIAAVNAANQVYLAFHAGTATLAQAQVSFATAQSAQTALAAGYRE